MIITRDEAFKAVCDFRTPIGEPNKYRVGTGMFISSPTGVADFVDCWILTASHVARETTADTQVVISKEDGTASFLPLSMFGPLSNWKHHPTADMSVFKIVPSVENQRFLEKRFVPLDHFNLKREVVSRDYELTAIGFPMGLGTSGMFSPFTFRSFASSGFVTLKRFDCDQPQIFFCLENPSVGGYSGGPVFDLGYSTNGVVMMNKGQIVCHGIMHGTISDDTGGKIAAVTPAFYLNDLIKGA